jgi:hypothetical protein
VCCVLCAVCCVLCAVCCVLCAVCCVHQIPSDNQTRQLLDPIEPSRLYPLLAELGEGLRCTAEQQGWRSVGDTLLIALDGTQSFSSQKISCDCCSHRVLSNGKTHYYHAVVTPMLMAPGQQQVVPLPPEFIVPQDGHDKQDCELAAAGRWLQDWGPRYAAWGATLLGDDLYCHQRVRFKLMCRVRSPIPIIQEGCRVLHEKDDAE